MPDRREMTTDASGERSLRIILDARPLQLPARNPTTAAYLDQLLRAFAGLAADTAGAAADDSFLFLLDTPGPDPSPRYPGLPFAGRRRLPQIRRLRAATLTLDPFLLRAVSIGATLGTRGARHEARAVLHITGGTLPIASAVPMVVTLLDLAAWELPAVYQRSVPERFGQRLRVRLLRQAERLIVASEATARAASRFLRFPRERVDVIPLAPTLGSRANPGGRDVAERLAVLRERLELPDRYLLFRAQYDARKDVPTLLRALGKAATDAPASPPHLVIDLPRPGDISTDEHASDAAAVRRLVERHGVGDRVRVLPPLVREDDAAVLAGARALVHPVVVEGSGLPVIDALGAGVPVVASNVGAVAELVGKAAILVPPGDSDRLAAALGTIWSNDRVRARLARAATASASAARSWTDVALETRAVYALAARRVRG